MSRLRYLIRDKAADVAHDFQDARICFGVISLLKSAIAIDDTQLSGRALQCLGFRSDDGHEQGPIAV
jgi:hypothetical protein